MLKKIAWFVVLAPSSSDQITLLNTTAADKKLAELPLYKDLLSSFLTKEVCNTPSKYGVATGPPLRSPVCVLLRSLVTVVMAQ